MSTMAQISWIPYNCSLGCILYYVKEGPRFPGAQQLLLQLVSYTSLNLQLMWKKNLKFLVKVLSKTREIVLKNLDLTLS